MEMEIILVGEVRGPGMVGGCSPEEILARVEGALTFQTGIRVSAEDWFSFGETMPADEMRRRAALKHRPLMSADVPALSWLTSGQRFCVREDNAIVLESSPLAWGHLDGKGGIAWCSEEKGAAWERGVRFSMTQPEGSA